MLFASSTSGREQMDGEIDHTLSMAIDGEKIAAIYLVRNPDKLRHAPTAKPTS
jgi:RNA polymerase sigma-70 factor, ECF subfamily